MEENELDDAYRRWGGEIYRRCLKLLGDAAAAKDATQDVFVRLMRHADRLTPDGGYLAWIPGGDQPLPERTVRLSEVTDYCRPPVAQTIRIHRISPVPNRPLPPRLESAKPLK